MMVVRQSWSLKNVENKLVIRYQYQKYSFGLFHETETLNLISLLLKASSTYLSLDGLFSKSVQCGCSPISVFEPSDSVLVGKHKIEQKKRHHEISAAVALWQFIVLESFEL